MSQKATPKSCSCTQCKYARAHYKAKYGNKEERAFRHRQDIALKKGSEDIEVALHGARNG